MKISKGNTQNFQGQDWKLAAKSLLFELEASKKAYASFIQADIFPHKRPYFEKSYRERSTFGDRLHYEFNVVAYESHSPSIRTNEPIFGPMELNVLEGNLTNGVLDKLIVQKEEELLALYQKLVSYDLPNITVALLQSQAETLNNNLLALKLDLRINIRKHSENMIGKARPM